MSINKENNEERLLDWLTKSNRHAGGELPGENCVLLNINIKEGYIYSGVECRTDRVQLHVIEDWFCFYFVLISVGS